MAYRLRQIIHKKRECVFPDIIPLLEQTFATIFKGREKE